METNQSARQAFFEHSRLTFGGLRLAINATRNISGGTLVRCQKNKIYHQDQESPNQHMTGRGIIGELVASHFTRSRRLPSSRKMPSTDRSRCNLQPFTFNLPCIYPPPRSLIDGGKYPLHARAKPALHDACLFLRFFHRKFELQKVGHLFLPATLPLCLEIYARAGDHAVALASSSPAAPSANAFVP